MSIPLPALDVRPPAPIDPLQQYAQALSLKSMIANQKTQQQQQQMNDINIQKQQRLAQDQQTIRQSFMDNNGDLDKTIDDVAKKGVQPETLQGLQLHRLDVKTKTASLTKSQLENVIKQNDMISQSAQAILNSPPEQQQALYAQTRAQMLQNGVATPDTMPEQYPGDDWLKFHSVAAMSAKDQAEQARKQKEFDVELPGKQAKSQTDVMANAAQTMGSATDQPSWTSRKGFLKAQGAPDAVLAQIPDQFSPDALVQVRNLGVAPREQEVSNQNVLEGRAAAGGATGQAAANTLNLQKRQKGNIAGAEAASRVQGEMAAMTGGGGGGTITSPQTAPGAQAPAGARPPVAPRPGAAQSGPAQPQPPEGQSAGAPASQGIPSGQLGNKNDQFLQTLNPSVANQVKAIAEGRIALPGGFALKSAYWQNMLRLVTQYDPSFDAVNYNSRANTRKDFTSGKSAQQINALNTVIGHIDQLGQKADELGNGNWQTLNSVENWFSQKFGSPKVTNFQAVAKSVSDELVRVWRGTGGSEKDIQERMNELSSSNSPAQLKGTLKEIGHLLESKLTAMQNQYQQGMNINDIQMVTPQSRKVLDKFEGKPVDKSNTPGGGGSAQFAVQAPNGKTYYFPTQQDADNFKAKLPKTVQ